MTDLTDKQIEMLYEMAEIHFQWFQRYSPNTTTFSDILEINHIKMNSIIDGCNGCDEQMIDMIFESIIRDYKEMLEDGI